MFAGKLRSDSSSVQTGRRRLDTGTVCTELRKVAHSGAWPEHEYPSLCVTTQGPTADTVFACCRRPLQEWKGHVSVANLIDAEEWLQMHIDIVTSLSQVLLAWRSDRHCVSAWIRPAGLLCSGCRISGLSVSVRLLSLQVAALLHALSNKLAQQEEAESVQLSSLSRFFESHAGTSPVCHFGDNLLPGIGSQARASEEESGRVRGELQWRGRGLRKGL